MQGVVVGTLHHISRETRTSIPGFPGSPLRPRGKDAGNWPVGFSQAPASLWRTSGRKHLPFAFVAQPGPVSHPSAAAPGARPICALPLPSRGPVPTVQRAQSGLPSAGAGALAGDAFGKCARMCMRNKARVLASLRRGPAPSQVAAGAAQAKVHTQFYIRSE